MNCAEVRDRIGEYYVDALDDAAPVNAHLAQCAGCREALAQVQVLDGLMRTPRRRSWVGASVAAALLVAGLVFLMRPTPLVETQQSGVARYRSGDRKLSVRTPAGIFESTNSEFVITVEDEMNRSTALAVGVVSVAVIAGAVYFRNRDGDAPSKIGEGEQARVKNGEISRPVPDDLRRELADARKKIEALEAENKSLKDQMKVAPMPRHVDEENPRGRGGDPDAIPELLSLGDARGDLFKKAYREMLEKLRQAEATVATVEDKDGVTTILIPTFPEKGAELAAEWQRQLESLLTPDERAKYDKHGMGKDLFKRGFGDWKQTVTITPGDNGTMVRNEAEKDGMKMVEATGGPDAEVLGPYEHLLKK